MNFFIFFRTFFITKKTLGIQLGIINAFSSSALWIAQTKDPFLPQYIYKLCRSYMQQPVEDRKQYYPVKVKNNSGNTYIPILTILAFFDLLCKDLLNSYNEAFCKGSLSVSQKRGTITLTPKGDENLTELKNWRPISLLNIDYKILSKVLARRMEKVLPKLVHSDQTGFVNGRYIGQNIRLLNDIMEYTDIKKTARNFSFC